MAPRSRDGAPQICETKGSSRRERERVGSFTQQLPLNQQRMLSCCDVTSSLLNHLRRSVNRAAATKHRPYVRVCVTSPEPAAQMAASPRTIPSHAY